MKIRLGFVSNSSSSSFVIAFDKKPKDEHDVLHAMFPLNKRCENRGVRDPYGENEVDPSTAAKLVWDQIKEQTPMLKGQILEEINHGYFDGFPDYNLEPEQEIIFEYKKLTGKNIFSDDADPTWRKRYNDTSEKNRLKFMKAVDVAAKKLLKKTYFKFKGKKCFVVSFSDNDNDISATLEHGDTFRSLPHLCISHH